PTTYILPLSLHDALPISLSKWECDKLYPIWPYWPRIVEYLRHNPFDDPVLGRPKGNESRDVALLSKLPVSSLGSQILTWRLKMLDRKSTRLNSSHQIISY